MAEAPKIDKDAGTNGIKVTAVSAGVGPVCRDDGMIFLLSLFKTWYNKIKSKISSLW
jgi:hypothetical protein